MNAGRFVSAGRTDHRSQTMDRIIAAISIMILAVAVSCQDGAVHRPEQLGTRTVDVPALKNGVLETLDCGIDLFALPDQSGLLHAILYVRAGVGCEPHARPGLSLVTLEALVKGGTSAYTPGRMEEIRRDRGFSISYRMAGEWVEIEIEALKGDEREALTIFRELLLGGAFPAKAVDDAKAALSEMIGKKGKNPLDRTRSALYELMSEGGEQRNFFPDPGKVAFITRSDVVSFYRRRFVPAGSYIAINSEPSAASALARELFAGAAKKSPEACSSLPEKAGESSVIILQKTGAEKACLGIGKILELPGGEGMLKEKPLLDILGEVLCSESPLSRMNAELRGKRNIAGNVSLNITASRSPLSGFLEAYADPNAQDVGFASYIMSKTLTDLASNPPSVEELEQAKGRVLRKIGRASMNPREFLMLNMSFILQGFPAGYLNVYCGNVSGADAAAVAECAGRHFSLPRYKYAVYGSGDKFLKEISVYGKVTMRGAGD